MINKEKIDDFEETYKEVSEQLERNLSKISEVRHFEIIGTVNDSLEISYEKGFIKYSEESFSEGIGLRLIGHDGREGITYTSDFSKGSLQNCIESGKQMIKVATPNKEFKDIAHPSDAYTEVKGIYDKKIENISLDIINNFFKPIFELKTRDLKPKGLSGDFSCSLGNMFLKNSNGINLRENYTSGSISCNVSLEKDGNSASGFEWQSVTDLDNFKIKEIANKSYATAEKGLNKKSIEMGKYPVILTPKAASKVLIGPIISAINAEKVQHNRSFLVDKIDTQIAVKSFSLSDDPHIPGKLGTESFDGEGVATQKIQIINDGALKELYHNTFTAGKAGIESNGHAQRSGYRSRVGITNHNVIMSPGVCPKKEMIEDTKKGILFEYTGDRPNMITGDFSGLIMVGYLIENGEIVHALKETMVGINILDGLKKISQISKERKWRNEVQLPHIKLENVAISSRR